MNMKGETLDEEGNNISDHVTRGTKGNYVDNGGTYYKRSRCNQNGNKLVTID